MDAQLKKGLLEVCVLSVLRGGESYGYKIISDVAPYIEISESTLYPILKRLEAADAVTTQSREYNGRLRKYYKITDKGLQKIDEFIENAREFERIYQFISNGGKL
ncbi:MAG TPA: PadR family transcriptional regulator [Candidatus Borkfalkia stercoripullorum]|nr:PadR family transcriptional regulator [Candidatus Borkfalkia stercoripullorum]